MNAPSRRMPPATDKKVGTLGVIVLATLGFGIIGGMIWVTFSAPRAAWILGPAVAAYGILVFHSQRQWNRLREERKEESICEFARMLPARAHNTWIVRAVYEELSRDRQISIRPLDRLEQDLGYLPEDFEDCLTEIARRSRRSLDASETNPLYGRIFTVADIVSFLEHQPTIQKRTG